MDKLTGFSHYDPPSPNEAWRVDLPTQYDLSILDEYEKVALHGWYFRDSCRAQKLRHLLQDYKFSPK